MNQPSNKLASMSGTFAIVSLAVGILGMLSFFYPPVQLFCGAAAIMLAYLSRSEKKLRISAVTGIILGVLSILLSIFFFNCFLVTLRFMDDPTNVAAYNEMVAQFKAQYEAIMSGVSAN